MKCPLQGHRRAVKCPLQGHRQGHHRQELPDWNRMEKIADCNWNESSTSALLHEDDGTPYCWNIDEEILTWIADSVRLWSNRDRTLWLCDPDLPVEVQQSMGIRVDNRIRSHIRKESGCDSGTGSSPPFIGLGTPMEQLGIDCGKRAQSVRMLRCQFPGLT